MPIELISKIEPKNSGAFPMVEDIHLEGGFRVVQDITERDAIPTLNRKEGMFVWVVDDAAAFRLDGGIDNTDWVAANFGGEGQFIVHKNMPHPANEQVLYQGWVPFDCVLIGVQVFMQQPNTQGTYLLEITNVNTGTSVLASTPFDMNTLAPATVTDVPVSGTATDLEFATEGRFVVSLTSDSVLYNGEGVYFAMYFQGGVPSTPGGTITPTLDEVLTEGNITGNNDIILTPGDALVGLSDLGVAGDVQITGGTSTSPGPDDGGDVVLTPGSGVGGGDDGEVRVEGDLRIEGLIEGLAPKRFVFQPGGTAEGNTYTNFSLLYADLIAASGLKEVIFDTSVVSPATVPAGTYDFTNTLLSDGNVRVGRSVNLYTMTQVVFSVGARLLNATAFRNLRLGAPGSGDPPILYNGGNTYLVSFEHCRLEAGGTTTLIEVVNNSTIVRFDLFETAVVDAGYEIVYVHDNALISLVGHASSSLATETLRSDATALFGTVTESASSDLHVDTVGGDQTNWAGAAPVAVVHEDDASRVIVDPTGLTVVTSTDVQGAIEELDAAIGAGGVTSVNGDPGPVVLLGLDDILPVGATTGGNNVTITAGDEIRGQYALLGSNNPGSDLVLRAGSGDGSGDGGDLVLHPGANGGTGTDGEARVEGNLYVTGKLTVDGSIDPTDVTFELSPIPSTGATQTAIFASDGTGGLNLGEMYARAPSNGAVTSLEQGGGGTGSTVVIENLTCTTSEVVGDVVYVSGTDTVTRAQADNAATTFAVGIIVAKPTTVTCDVAVGGEVGVFAGLTAGTRYYLDETTPGALRATPPGNPGDFITKIGVALNATTLILQIDPPVLLT